MTLLASGLVGTSLVGTAHAQSTTTTTTTAAPSPQPSAPGNAPTSADPTMPDPAIFRDLATQVARNEKQIVELTGQLELANAREAQLATELAEVEQQLAATRAELEELRRIVRSRAAFIYAHATSPQASVVDIEHIEDITSGKKYAETATRSDAGKINRLVGVVDQLDGRRRELDDAHRAAATARDQLQLEKDTTELLLVRQKKALDDAGAITVMGNATLTAEQMTNWFNSRGVRYRLMGNTTMTDLAQLYLDEGAAEHVRPELAFVQAVLETGSFGNATDNNFAGIGACDSCTGQIPFATPREGVQGHIQMLRNYADPTSRAANLANPPSAPIYGSNPVGSAHAYDTFFAKGRVPTWNLMGNGNWATDPGYAPKVLTLYFQLMSYATRLT
jgi:hypothetical protein